jgi:hypothetical protein
MVYNRITGVSDFASRPVFYKFLKLDLFLSSGEGGKHLEYLSTYKKTVTTITTTILDIIHRSVFYLKHDVSETGVLSPSRFHLKAEQNSLRIVAF